MRPRKKKRRQLEKLQLEMEKAGERFGLDPSFAPRLMPREIPDQVLDRPKEDVANLK
ncbi:MAG: hypothetical protein ABII93_06095 [Chrysiogenia bacterium]